MQIPMRQEYIRLRLQVQRPEQRVVIVDPDRLALHSDAAEVLQQAAQEVAAEAGVPPSVIHDRLFQYVFCLVPSGILVLVLSVPERDVEISVELPSAMWQPVAPERDAS